MSGLTTPLHLQAPRLEVRACFCKLSSDSLMYIKCADAHTYRNECNLNFQVISAFVVLLVLLLLSLSAVPLYLKCGVSIHDHISFSQSHVNTL